ncbi:MAG: protein-disulfide reductase DsbD domain-containing protein [Bacteroidota bacterium]
MKKRIKTGLRLLMMAVASMVFSVNILKAQIMNPVKWSYAAKLGAGGVATIYLKASIEEGWHVYSVNQKPGGPQKTVFTFAKSPAYTLIGKVTEPKPLAKFEEVFDIQVMYFSNEVVFQQKVKLKGKQATVKGKVGFMACTDQQCLPPDEVEFSVLVK